MFGQKWGKKRKMCWCLIEFIIEKKILFLLSWLWADFCSLSCTSISWELYKPGSNFHIDSSWSRAAQEKTLVGSLIFQEKQVALDQIPPPLLWFNKKKKKNDRVDPCDAQTCVNIWLEAWAEQQLIKNKTSIHWTLEYSISTFQLKRIINVCKKNQYIWHWRIRVRNLFLTSREESRKGIRSVIPVMLHRRIPQLAERRHIRGQAHLCKGYTHRVWW